MVRLLFFITCFASSVLQAQFGGLRFRELPGASGVVFSGINDNGEMVGNHREMGAVLIQPDGMVTPLGVEGTVSAINNRGQMLINRNGLLFLRQPDGRLDPRVLEGATAVYGYGLNSRGEIAGGADGVVVWDAEGAGRRVPMSVPGSVPTMFSPPDAAFSINDHGELAGLMDWDTARYAAFRKNGAFDSQVTAGGFQPGGGLTALTNDGLLFLSAYPALHPGSTTVQHARGYNLFTGNSARETLLRGVSLNGRLAVGNYRNGPNFIAETCETTVSAREIDVGTARVQVEADADCEWSAPANGRYRGSREVEFVVSPTALVYFVAGKEIPVRQNVARCYHRLPGESIWAPRAGLEIDIPLETGDGCEWQVERLPQGLRIEPARGRGPAVLRLTVLPSNSARPQRLSFSIATPDNYWRDFSVLQEAQLCSYQPPVIPSRLVAGPGSAYVQWENTPSECGTITSGTPWIRVGWPRRFTFWQNRTGASRSGILRLDGQDYPVTQDAPTEGQPFLLEPEFPNGIRSNFHFTWLEKAGEPLSQARLQIGHNCFINYLLGFRPFEVSGTCELHEARSFLAAGQRTLALDLTIPEEGNQPIIADGRHAGFFFGRDREWPDDSLIKPLPVPEVLPEGSRWWISGAGTMGGTFRISHSGASSTQAARLTFQPAFTTDPALGCVVTIELQNRTATLHDDLGQQLSRALALGSKETLENRKCVVDAEQSTMQRMDSTRSSWVIDLRILFRGSWSLQYSSTQASLQVRADDGAVATQMLGYYHVNNAVRATLVEHEGVVRVLVRTVAPVARAEFFIGACPFTYTSADGLRLSPGHADSCADIDTAQAGAFRFGKFLTLVLPFRPGIRGSVAIVGNVTPEGLIENGFTLLGTATIRP